VQIQDIKEKDEYLLLVRRQWPIPSIKFPRVSEFLFRRLSGGSLPRT